MTYKEYKEKAEKLIKAVHYYSELRDAFAYSNLEKEMKAKWWEAEKARNEFTNSTVPMLENGQIAPTKEEATEYLELQQRVWPREARKEAEAEIERLMATGEVEFE